MAKILIVEDDLSFGTLIQTWLRKKGFEVEKATSVKGALLLLEKDGDRDLILSDFRLPDQASPCSNGRRTTTCGFLSS